MIRTSLLVALSLVALNGCVSGGPGAVPVAESGAQWIESPGQEVRTLFVEPSPVSWATPEPTGGSLAVGGFFARWTHDRGALDQLALMLVLEGADPTRLASARLDLYLQIDGELFVGSPGVTSNSVRYDPRGGGRTTIAVPISLACLRKLATASEVRGRIGDSAPFDLSSRDRARLRTLLERIPTDVKRADVSEGLRAQVALSEGP